MTFGPVQIRPGMEVIGTTGAPIGRIKEAHDADFIVDRASAGDVTLTYDKVRALLGSQVVLSIGPDQMSQA
jgi:hypothetical protein